MYVTAQRLLIISLVTILYVIFFTSFIETTLDVVAGEFWYRNITQNRSDGFVQDEIKIEKPKNIGDKLTAETVFPPRFGKHITSALENNLWQYDITSLSDNKERISEKKLKIYNTYFQRNRNSKQINCQDIFRDNTSYIQFANSLSYRNHYRRTLASQYINITNDCSKFIVDKGYITNVLSEEEANFSIAYSILMYRFTEQAERLLRAIYRPHNVYCIHVDATTKDSIYMAMAGIANCFDNVFLTSRRINVKWGTYTVLEPDILCMEELLKYNKKWKYFINLTAQEFPLKTNYELVRILKAYNGSNDIEALTAKRYRSRWKKAPKAPYYIKPIKGAVHIAASRGFVDYVVHDQRAIDILNWTKNTYIPDETFFSTLNHNPHLSVPGSYKGYPMTTNANDGLKPYLARFKNRRRSNHYHWPCHGKRVRGMCIFGMGDLPLLEKRKELFANKFHLAYNPFAYECMEELIFNRTRDEFLGKLTFNSSWYETLGFVKYKVS